jgi:protoporphyrinogen oxidase
MEVPKEVKEIAEGLIYRDFITVGLLLRKFKNHVELKDNWIYIQESDVRVGRLQIFNNWSPSLVENPNYYWVGLEYFCQQNDDLWSKSDEEMIAFAREEMVKLNLVERDDILDGTSLRVPKTYPAYFGSYDRFDVLMQFLDSIPNLYPIGRNGMHRYNNQDHSMLTAFRSVDSILYGNINKKSIWEINTEMEYHEEK